MSRPDKTIKNMLIDLLYDEHLRVVELEEQVKFYKHQSECWQKKYESKVIAAPDGLLSWSADQLSRFVTKLEQRIKELDEDGSDELGDN